MPVDVTLTLENALKLAVNTYVGWDSNQDGDEVAFLHAVLEELEAGWEVCIVGWYDIACAGFNPCLHLVVCFADGGTYPGLEGTYTILEEGGVIPYADEDGKNPKTGEYVEWDGYIVDTPSVEEVQRLITQREA